MRLTNINGSLSWASEFFGKAVVYLLKWEGRNYIGSSINLPSRLYWWRYNLKGASTRVRVLLVCSKELRHFYERAAIAAYRTVEEGHNKTTDGRPGAVCGRVVSIVSREKISRANTGKKRSGEAKEKMREAKLGKKQTPEHVANRAKRLLGHAVLAETREKISKANKGKPKTEAHRLALVEAWKRRRCSHATN